MDDLGYGRIPATWWTLNQRYYYEYELHRLNVKDTAKTAAAVRKNDAVSRRYRFDFVRDAPDIATWFHTLRAESS